MSLFVTIKKSLRFLLLLAVLGGLFGVHPYVVARFTAGQGWQGVVPEFKSDSLYYITHANSVIHGNFLGENPYYKDAYEAPAASFSLTDFVSGIPYIFFSPFVATVFNAFLWNAVFAFLVGVILLWAGYSWLVIIPLWLIVHSSDFGFMLRTSSMQLVYPYFFLFLILFFSAWSMGEGKNENHPWRSSLPLGVVAGLAAYWQPFLFQVIAASLCAGVLLAFAFRRKELSRSLLISMTIMVFCSLFYFVYFHGISGLAVFGEVMNYLGAVRTYIPPPQVYFFGRWLIVLLVWAFLLSFARFGSRDKNDRILEEYKQMPSSFSVVLVIAAVSIGTLGAMVQNILTGVDVASATHTYRFIIILLALGAALFLRPTFEVFSFRGFFVQKSFLFLCAMIVIARVFFVLPGTFPKYVFYSPEMTIPPMVAPVGNPQYVMPALQALRSLPSKEVIAAPEPLNSYITLYTDKHVLVSSWGDLFVGTIESTERGLVAELGRPMTFEVYQKEHSEPAMFGRVAERNRVARKLCALVLVPARCTSTTFARLFTEEGVVQQSQWFDFYQTIVKHPVAYLRKFDVSQVVLDRRLPIPEFLNGQTPWYSDAYYEIYDIALLSNKGGPR